MTENPALERIVARVGDLPAMPASVSEVLRITDDPSTGMGEVGAAIQGDPALTAKILRVSNSSYYGMKQYVGTLKLALVILGVREVRNIVLGISVYETLKDKNTDVRIAERIWNESLRTASIAKKLGEGMKLGLQGEEFIAGLLTDIGKMVILRQNGDEYAQILRKHGETSPEDLCHAELVEMGFTHADAAAALATNWNLPKTLLDALWCQYPNEERPLKSAKDPHLAGVIRVAKAAAHDDFSQPEMVQALNDQEAWRVLDNVKEPMAPGQRFEVLKGYIDELKDASNVPLE